MHRQVFGAPGASNKASKSRQFALVTGRKLSGSTVAGAYGLAGSVMSERYLKSAPRQFGLSVAAARTIECIFRGTWRTGLARIPTRMALRRLGRRPRLDPRLDG